MSGKVVDSKIVEMKFDNKDFEANVATSMSTLDKLKQALKFDGADKAFENVEKAAANTDISPLSKATEAVSEKFSVLEQIAIGALRNIGSAAESTAEKFIKSMSTDNIAAGWQKFSDMTVHTGTLVSQGFDLDIVNQQLERLNWFTDETSYALTNMVENIAKFTATGQDLQTSVTAMEGIANWAALSGQNAQVASRAMYNISQAMGAGAMKLIDYKSIQNASMDTDEFRQHVLDAAVELGRLNKAADGVYETLDGKGRFTKPQFTTELARGWFDKEVMMKVFNEYSAAVDQIYQYAEERGITASEAIDELGDKVDEFGLKAFKAAQEARTWGDTMDAVKDAVSTGWMTTFRNIFGNYEEAKTLWTKLANELYDVFAEGGNKRNELLSAWKDMGGRRKLLEAFWNIFNALRDSINLVKEAFREIFPPMTATKLFELTNSFAEFTNKLRMNEEEADKIKSILKGVFSILKIGVDTVKAFVAGLSPLSHLFDEADDGSVSLIDSMAELAEHVTDAANSLSFFDEITTRVSQVVANLVGYLRALVKNNIADFLVGFNQNGNILTGILTALAGNIGNLIRLFFNFGSAITGIDLSAVRDKVLLGFTQLLAGAINPFDTFIKDLKARFANIEQGFNQFFTGSLGDILKRTFKFVGDAFIGFADFLDGLRPGKRVRGLIDDIADTFAEFSERFDLPSWEAIAKFATAGALFFIGKGIFDFVNFLNKSPLNEALVGVLESVQGCLDAYQDRIKAKTIKDIASSIMMLALSLVALSRVPAHDLAVALIGLGSVFVGLMITLGKIEKMLDLANIGMITSIGQTIIYLSGSLLFLSLSIKMLADVPYEDVGKGLFAIGVELLELCGAAFILSKSKKVFLSTAKSMIFLAGAVDMLTIPLIIFSKLDIENVSTGVAGLTGIIFSLTLAMMGLSIAADGLNRLNAKKFALTMLTMVAAINLMVPPIIALATVSKLTGSLLPIIGDLAIMLAAMAASLSLIIVASSVFPQANILAASVALLAMAASLNIIVPAITAIGLLPFDVLNQGLTTLGIALAALVGSVLVISASGPNVLAAGAAMLLVATALGALIGPIQIMGMMDVDTITQGLVVIGGALMIMSVALIAIGMAGPNVIIGAVAMNLLAASFIVLAVAVNMLVPAIIALRDSFAENEQGTKDAILAVAAVMGGLLVAALAAIGILALLSKVLLPVIPAIILGSAALALFNLALASLVPTIIALTAVGADAVVAMIEGFHVFAENSNQVVMDIGVVLEAVSRAIFNWLGNLLVGLLEGLNDITYPLCDVILEILEAILEVLVEHLAYITYLVVECINEIIHGVSDATPDFVDALVDLCISIIDAIADALIAPENVERLRNSLLRLLVNLAGAIGIFFGVFTAEDVTEYGDGFMQALIQGMGEAITDVMDFFEDFGAKVYTFVQTYIVPIFDFFEEVGAKIYDFVHKVQEVLDGLFTGMKEFPSEVKEMGEELANGLVGGLNDKKNEVLGKVKGFGDSVINKFKDVFDINSPSEELRKIGQMILSGLNKGLGDSTGQGGIMSTIKGIGGGISDFFTGMMPDIEDLGFLNGMSYFNGWDAAVTEWTAKINNKDGTTNWGAYYAARNAEVQRELAAAKTLNNIDMSSSVADFGVTTAEAAKKTKKGSKSASNSYEKATKELRDKSIKAYKELFELYEKGKITRIEYETKYTQILKDAMWTRADVVQEATESMEKYATDKIKEINKTYEKELSEIQKNIDKFADSMAGDFKDAFTFTDVKAEVEKFSDKVNGDFKDIFQFKTNKDIYDEKVKDFDDQITKLEEKQKKYAEMYGEQSDWAQSVQREIDKVKKAEEDYKKEYADSGKDDSKIVEVSFKDKLKKETMDLQAYRIGLEKLKKKGLSDTLRDTIAEMSQEEGIAFVRYLNSLTDEEFKAIEAQWALKQKESEKLGKSLYGDKDTDISFNNTLEQETKDLEEYLGELKKLRARGMSDILKETIAGMSQEEGLQYVKYLNSLSDEAFAAIEQQWKDKTDMAKELGEFLYEDDIKDATSKYKGDITNTLADLPDSAREIGMNTARSLAEGFSEEALGTLDIINGSVDAIIERAIKTVPVIDRVSIGKEQMSADYNALLKEKYGTTIIPELGTSLAYRPTLNTTQNTRSVSQINASPSSFASVNASMNTNTKELTKLSKTVDRGFNNLGDRIGCMAIVMDRNSLADGLASPINDRIGRIIVRKGRGG